MESLGYPSCMNGAHVMVINVLGFGIGLGSDEKHGEDPLMSKLHLCSYGFEDVNTTVR